MLRLLTVMILVRGIRYFRSDGRPSEVRRDCGLFWKGELEATRESDGSFSMADLSIGSYEMLKWSIDGYLKCVHTGSLLLRKET